MTQDEELSKYMVLIEQYKEQMNTLDTQSQYLQAAVADYSKAKITLEQLSKADDGSEALIPIGGSVYLYANVKDTSKVLFDVGAGITTEKSFDDAIKKIDERIDNIQKNQEKLGAMIEQLQAEAIEISNKAQKLLSEQEKK
jgi:prefoldin alpha subunit